MTTKTNPTPTEIGRANKHDIKINWNTGDETVYPARLLRLACPCAACIDEISGEKILDEKALPDDVHPTGITPVGRYAIQIQWSDGHNTGLYTWERLWSLAQQLSE